MLCSEELIQKVWEKASIIPNNDPKNCRRDECGAWIIRGNYGYQKSQYGWEIDHIKPKAEGGRDEVANLRPVQWRNIVHKDGSLACTLTANGKNNEILK
jgi:5-methylcytosine-specific restriction endonuclease McrA